MYRIGFIGSVFNMYDFSEWEDELACAKFRLERIRLAMNPTTLSYWIEKKSKNGKGIVIQGY